MYGNNNNKIEIEAVENGYVVTIIIMQPEKSPLDMINTIMPAIERIQNKAIGDNWKNDMQDEIDHAERMAQPKPVRQYVCANWEAVLKIINEQKI